MNDHSDRAPSAARILAREGLKAVAASDSSGEIFDGDGLDAEALMEPKENGGSVAEYEGGGEAPGGVTVRYFERVQNAQNMSWEEETVSTELERGMTQAYDRVSPQAREAGVSLREAAFMVAVREVTRAMELRGL